MSGLIHFHTEPPWYQVIVSLDKHQKRPLSRKDWTKIVDETKKTTLMLTVCVQPPEMSGRKLATKPSKHPNHQPTASSLHKRLDGKR